VDSRGIIEALRGIYNAAPLVEELTGVQPSESAVKPATIKEKK